MHTVKNLYTQIYLTITANLQSIFKQMRTGKLFFSSKSQTEQKHKKYHFFVILPLFFIFPLLSACIRPYTPTVQQGNIVTTTEIQQLQLGMSKTDVIYLLGTPILPDDFNTNSWNYTYSLKKENQPLQTKHLVLHFYKDKLASIEK